MQLFNQDCDCANREGPTGSRRPSSAHAAVDAIAEFEQAFEIFERVRGADFIGCRAALTNMSLSFRKIGDDTRADEALNEARSRRNAELKRRIGDRFTNAEIERLRLNPNPEIQRLFAELDADSTSSPPSKT